MNIAVIGTGYVGLVTGVCLAEIGNNVTCIDLDEAKISTLKVGISPIFEEGLEELLNKNMSLNRISFTNDYEEGLFGKDVIYIAVGTPQMADGSADLSYIESTCEAIGHHLSNDTIIVTKSTVPVGTNDYIKARIHQYLKRDLSIKIVSNPEFLKQGTAVYDTFHGDRIVIGSDDAQALEILEEINAPFHIPIIKTDLRSAEMIKYASNAFLATKISFINEMANLCEKVGANIDSVSRGIGMDTRIGSAFLNAGTGYGGSCFPKDTRAIISTGRSVGLHMQIIDSAVRVNEMQKGILVDKMIQQFGDLNGKKIALLGLSFKPNTDDMREAPSILVAEKLIKEGAIIQAYDPVSIENAKKVLPYQVNYKTSIQEAITNVDIAIILSEWDVRKTGHSPVLFMVREYPIICTLCHVPL
ncbi:UDP-glucose/GDP-mannose dehydrogenase family protein, partial [Heyndrickxia sporothermodurans]|uniref:UDP-glucose dehydrogenase family protein n=1 Tax=Heyndrickxia sporothermodurans TaxID=46224 RepID=UPI002E224138|nr:UDP-glucose/GDP-mannose dehydrogenase family protein [Heyndrickxia sporothermodurans]